MLLFRLFSIRCFSFLQTGTARNFLTAGFLLLHSIITLGQSTSKNNFYVKGFHLDLRIQAMKMPALKLFVSKLRKGGINTLVMEYEATYPFDNHPLIPGRYAYTKKELKSFIAFCDSIGIDVIPLQQSFGHVEYILRHYRYAELREDDHNLSQVCPLETEQDSLLFLDLYKDLCSVHHSKYVHIGCDETYLLGHCAKCRAKVEKEGISKLYIDYVSMLCRILISLGKTPVLWADIALKYPEAIKSLPKQTIFIDWNYGWEPDRFGKHQQLTESGFEIWGAPALRSHPDDYFLTQWEKHFNNIRDFIPYCRELNYKGVVMTSWSTSGGFSYRAETEDGTTQLYPTRHVYPITAFQMLLAAYTRSIDSIDSLTIPDFIRKYCKSAYGLDPADAANFWQALKVCPYEVKDGKVISKSGITLETLTDSISWASRVFAGIKPKKGQQEFAQYLLMTDIRLNYLHFALLENKANQENLQTADIPQLINALNKQLKTEEELSKRFTALNSITFYESELEEENQLRKQRILDLRARLMKLR